MTIWTASAPRSTLRLLIAALVCGALLLLPSFYYLFRIFKGETAFAPLTGGAAALRKARKEFE